MAGTQVSDSTALTIIAERLAADFDGPCPICSQNCGCSPPCKARTAAALRSLAAENARLRDA
jgi:hypothetical protein